MDLKKNTMEEKHTKGQWTSEMWGGVPHRIISTKKGAIAEISTHVGEEEYVANSKLMASAPRLLKALIKITEIAKGILAIKQATG